MKTVFILITIGLFFFSCDKENRKRYRMAGVWNIEEVERKYYTNGNLDSTQLDSDVGVWLMEDNSSDIGNRLRYIHDKTPPSFFASFCSLAGIPVKDGNTSWYFDGESNKRFTLVQPGDLFDTWTILTVLKRKKNKLVFQVVIPDPNDVGNPRLTEVMTLKRK